MENTLKNAETLIRQGKLKKAHKLLTQALNKKSDNPTAVFLLGETLLLMNHLDKALAKLSKAASSDQAQPCWHFLHGVALEKKGLFLEAENSYILSERLGCTDKRLYYVLGNFYSSIVPDFEKSELYYAYLIKTYPDEYFAYVGLSGLYITQKRYEEAIQALDVCLTNGYERPIVYINLGHALSNQGRQKAALSCDKKAIELDPKNVMARQNCIVQSLYAYDNQADLYREIIELTSVFDSTSKPRFTGDIDCTPGRKLKVGFISADLRTHAICHYFLPYYRFFDKSKFSIHIYYNHFINDHFTEEYKRKADSWCNCRNLADEQLAQQIRSDKIDILIDLSNHSADNRLAVFRKKPAPMQVSLMGLPVTTGMKCMDYAIKQASIIEACSSEKYSTEKILTVDNTSIYDPLMELPALAEPPCIKNGFITFGSFNGLRKIDIEIFEIWAKLLLKTTNSKIRIIIEDDQNPLMSDYIYDQFANFGIDRSRVILLPRMERDEYFASHNLVDIALDPYPYHGETTTHNLLLMGLPLVSRAGKTDVSNISTRLLTAINKPEWLAKDYAEYIEIATSLAADKANLSALRKTLRHDIKNSPITDYEGATRDLEKALLAGWTETCEKYC